MSPLRRKTSATVSSGPSTPRRGPGGSTPAAGPAPPEATQGKGDAGRGEPQGTSGRPSVGPAKEGGAKVPAASIASFCSGKLVYLSIDVDALDSSEMPATGTPEPGGLSYRQVLALIDEVARSAERIVGLDVVELAPIEGMHAPDFLAARVAYKAITAALSPTKPRRAHDGAK